MSDPSKVTDSTRLVVETLHHELVGEVLQDLQLTLLGEPEDNKELGLTRLTVERPGALVGNPDRLVLEVRRRIAARFGGWVPALGKDRESPAEAMRRSGTQIAMGLGFLPAATVKSEPPHADLRRTARSRMSLHPGVRLLPPRDSEAPVRIGLIDVPLPDRSAELDPETASLVGHSVFTLNLIERVAPRAQIELRGVLAPDDHGTTTWDVVTAMVDLAVNWKADIIAMPLGGFTADGQPPLLYSRAMARIQEHSMVIAAAGNHVALPGWGEGISDTAPAWPAALPGVIAVGGQDLSAASDTQLPWVDVVSSISTFTADFPLASLTASSVPASGHTGLATGTGTSFCAVYAAAAVAARMGEGLSAGEAWNSVLNSGASQS